MAAVLIAVVVALVLGHAVPALANARQFGWFDAWMRWLGGHLGTSGQASTRAYASVLLGIGIPVAVVAVIQSGLAGAVFGFPAFVFAAAVLFYCWGPRDLDLDVTAIAEAPDSERRRVAARVLLPPDAAPVLGGPVLVSAVFREALRRWFGVLLWFLLLGPFGALLYRLAQLAAFETPGLEPPARAVAQRLAAIVDWPAAQLMVLGLALAAHFDAVFAAWRDWHAQRGQGYLQLDTGFLEAAGRASVRTELAEEAELADGEEPPRELPELHDAMSLNWRVLLVWLTVLALVVLAGFVN
ncbi:MAG TPA: hypothetical protein VFG21_07870 [Xanthomonadaceae bacterium]|nr:hypothetical protein [Xanthomonadaceae bacterium]